MNIRNQGPGAFTLRKLAMATGCSLACALGLSACQNVQGFTATSLVRVIDASYIAPAASVYVEGQLFASNIGEGYISNYSTVTPTPAGAVQIIPAKATTPTATTAGSFTASTQHSVFITDNGASPTQYVVTVLQDQSTPAAAGQSDFRFLNQAPRTGAVDVYMLPANAKLADSVAVCANLAVGATCGYTPISSQTLTMEITPTGKTTPAYTSQPIALVGGEVRTVVIVDSQLTTNPPVSVLMADDLN